MQINTKRDHPVKRTAQQFAPMRVHVVFDDSVRLNPIINAAVSDPTGPFQQALRVLSNGLMVRPIQGNVTIPPACTNITSGPNVGKCRNGTQRNRCGIFTVPDELAGTVETCDGSFGPCSDQGPGGLGVGADFILFVGSLNSECMHTAII